MPEIDLAVPLVEFYDGLEFEANEVEDGDPPAPATA